MLCFLNTCAKFQNYLTIQNPRKFSLKEELKKRLNPEFFMLREK